MGKFETDFLPGIKQCDSLSDKVILAKYNELNEDGVLSQAEDLYLQSMAALKTKGIQGSSILQRELFGNEITRNANFECDISDEGFYEVQTYYDIIGLPPERIETAKTNLENAVTRLLASSAFRSKAGYSKADSEVITKKYFALMMKESALKHLDDDGKINTSTGGALGYFQLKQKAVTDAQAYLKANINRNNTYDVNNPEDNCILGIIYYESRRVDIKKISGIPIQDVDKFTLFSYNAGPGNFKALLDLYVGDNGSTDISWESFATWLSVNTLGGGVSSFKNDSVYGGKYIDWFNGNDLSSNAKTFIAGENVTVQKVYEAVNYVEKIENISQYGLVRVKNKNIQNSDEDAQNEEGIVSNNESIDFLSVRLERGQNISSLLEAQGLNKKFAKNVFNFNKKTNEAFGNIENSISIPADTEVFVPLWSTGFYSQGEVSNVDSNREVVKDGTFNFDSWVSSIEVLSEELKGKVFILDPGHGGPDLGAHPIARDGNGNPIPDSNSAVKYISEGRTQRVKPGDGSDFLHVYESLVTVDVVYRLAKLLRERGAEVYVTRYNKTTGIIDDSNMTTPKTSDDIYADTGESWKYSRGGNRTRLRRGVEIGNSILDKKDVKQENAFFLSIHADAQPRLRNLPIVLKYYKGRSGTSQQGKKFANELVKHIEFRGKKALAGGQPLYIVNPSYNEIGNSLLVELANMNDPGSAYVLRQSGTQKNTDGTIIRGRQQFAEALYEGIFKALVKN